MPTADPTDIALRYFDAVQAADRDRLRALFAAEAEMVSIGAGFAKGADAIADYYSERFFGAGRRLRPEIGPFIVLGDTVAVEVRARGEDGTVSFLADFFHVQDGLIQSLHVYYGPTTPDEG